MQHRKQRSTRRIGGMNEDPDEDHSGGSHMMSVSLPMSLFQLGLSAVAMPNAAFTSWLVKRVSPGLRPADNLAVTS